MLRYEMTDTQLIKSMHVHATDMNDCMQLKVKIIVFHAQSIDFQRFITETSLIFEY